jgi:peptide/nickel transport system substrate-binding protein
LAVAAAVPLMFTGTVNLAGATPVPASQAQSSTINPNTILTIGRENNTIFTRNFNPFAPVPNLGVVTAIYEPLVIYTPTNSKYTPWLAKSWSYGPNAMSLTFNLRSGVLWSDGQPFSATDVAYTFQILKKWFAGGGFPYIKNVIAVNPTTVEFTFSQPSSIALGQVGQQVIVPKHIWDTVSNPVDYTNPDPVGTGPFTQIENFEPQGYVIGRNPNYWQPGKPYFAGIRYPAYAGDSVNYALYKGELDWSDLYIPDVQKTYVAKDPKHYYYFFGKTGGTINLVFNTTLKPLNDAVVRKAISMAINRQANVDSVYGNYTAVGNCTGVTPVSSWYDPAVANSCGWTTENVAKANAMLDAAGYKRGSDGIRVSPSGQKMEFTLETGVTSSDYVQSAENVAADVKAIGIDLVVTPKSWSTVISDVNLGHFQVAHMYGLVAPTPYNFFDFYMACANVVPVGQTATENWGRFCDPKADKLLARMATATTTQAQHAVADQLEALFAADAPAVPLFTQPDWGEFNTTRFTGFPTASNPYATGQSRYPGAFLIETTIKPVPGAFPQG